jgi:hypothetical protein
MVVMALIKPQLLGARPPTLGGAGIHPGKERCSSTRLDLEARRRYAWADEEEQSNRPFSGADPVVSWWSGGVLSLGDLTPVSRLLGAVLGHDPIRDSELIDEEVLIALRFETRG